jgi:hypothetical protein
MSKRNEAYQRGHAVIVDGKSACFSYDPTHIGCLPLIEARKRKAQLSAKRRRP